MGRGRADEHEKEQDSSDEEEEETSKAHQLLFEEVRKNGLGWIDSPTNLTLNIVAEDSCHKYAEKKAEFKKKYKPQFRGGLKGNTIIHTLADEKDKDMRKFKPLLELVLELEPSLLGEWNESDATPLHSAIQTRNSSLVELLCQIAPSPGITIKQKFHENNCLHAAIKEIKRGLAFHPAIHSLIEKSDDEALREGDADGNTPLHLAVEREHFTDTDNQLLLVKKLVEKCPGALKMTNKKKLAPFLYLQACRREFKGSKSTDSKPVLPPPPGPPTLGPPTSGGPANKALDRVDSVGPEPNTKATRGPERPEHKKKKKPKKIELSDDQVLLIFRDIEKFLKKYILQKFLHSEAQKLLYGPLSGDHNIDFNLLAANRRLTPEMIKKDYKFLNFEDILQYVALPNLLPNIQTPSQTTSGKEKKHKSEEGQTPTHYKEIFEWLRRRNVKEVLRIIVEDDLDNPHSDEVIVTAIKGLGVEVWDWKKYDICSETIREAAPDVQVVHLYTSGNNAVLRGWSDQDGLRRLTKLKKLLLFVKGLESHPTTKKNIDEFKTRLEKLIEWDDNERFLKRDDLEKLINRTESGALIKLDDVQKLAKPSYVEKPKQSRVTIEIKYEDLSEKSHISRIPKMTSDQQRAHRWLDCVTGCAQWMRNSDTKRQVKVALIDDGVDASHFYLRDYIQAGVTYCTSYRGNKTVNSSYYASSSGHGTLMATLICNLCPAARLYVAKLDDQGASEGSAFTASSAAEAVRWAVRMEVDIISMSWTIEKSEENEEKKKALIDLDDALEEAAKKDILMFCAARDEGLENPKQVPYPAASRTKNIMIIGAAGPSGTISAWVNPNAIHFLFPGIDLRSARPDWMPPEMPTVDGSSTATALASGLAALLLMILAKDTTGAWDPAATRGRHQKINNILDGVKNDKNYVQVWDLFDEFTKNSKTEGDSVVLQNMVNWILSKAKY